MSQRNYTVQTKILKPVSDVYDAIVNNNSLCKYFTDDTSGPLVEGQRIIWNWEQWGDYPVEVKKIIPHQLIHLELNSGEWRKTDTDAYQVGVVFEFESLEDGSTMLTISEQGWRTDVPGLKASHENCSGWTHMAMCLKGWLEHGINMR